MDRDEFVERAQRPEFGETMTFQIQRQTAETEKTFSAEAIEDTARQIAMFIAARTMARWEQTGEPPRFVSADVTLDWKAEPGDQPGPPWYRGRDGEPPDGAHRRQR